ncbi:MAG: polyphosphate polymerase domain-containing protein [Lachnospiraceae bacterium]|nr:polyphosphate polymerase domain-containing protein [Lachnospiraceae bacterium]
MAANLDVSREEKKYVLTYMEAEKLYLKLKQILPGDEVNGYNSYMVRSLYFDSYYNDDYFDKVAGIKDRKKIRVRIYDVSAEKAKLEVKQKEGNMQRKRSISITRKEAEMLCKGDYEFLLNKDDKLAEDIYYIMHKETYRPKCIVEYKRRAFAVPTNNIRITFDSEIAVSEGNLNIFDNSKAMLVPIESRNKVILEVKYNNFLLSYIKDALQLCDAPQESYSKYTTGRYWGLS